MVHAIATPNPLLTEFNFTLPRGLIDDQGSVHRHGVMRLATARDELIAAKHRQVQTYPEYLMLVLLAQVITRLGSLDCITPERLENLFTQDLSYLRELYNRVNQTGSTLVPTQCPQCGYEYKTELVLAGEL